MGRMQGGHGKKLAQLMEEGRSHQAEENHAAALKCFKAALERSPKNLDAMEAYGFTLLETGDVEEGQNVLQQCISTAPNNGSRTYFVLAQLSNSGEQAVELYEKGIEIANGELQNEMDEKVNAKLEEEIVGALCGLAEVFLEMAEVCQDRTEIGRLDEKAERVILQALALAKGGQSMMETLQTLANLRLSQGRREEALKAMAKVLSYVSPHFVRNEDSAEMEEQRSVSPQDTKNDTSSDNGPSESNANEADKLDSLPSVPVLIAIAKQLLEVEEWNGAKETLRNVVQACDYNMEAWYFLAFAHMQMNELDQALDASEEIIRLQGTPADEVDGIIDAECASGLKKQIEERKTSSKAS